MIIEMQDITRVYEMDGRILRAVDSISLQVEAGEFVAIVGPSGSGKSTLMNIIACLDTPTSGLYKLDGVEVSKLNDDDLSLARNSKIGLVFQSYNLLSRMTALENVELPRLYGTQSGDGDHARRALGTVGLEDRINHWPSQLSGGQQQRVAIARALINDPAIILADEPTGALDTRSGIELMSIFQRLNREGRTIVLVTHEPAIAEHAHRIISIRDGRIVSDEPVAEPRQSDAELAKLPVEEVRQ
ncbi:MAG: ABC transporter ATP-binding protein [Armatimonadota bacterium]